MKTKEIIQILDNNFIEYYNSLPRDERIEILRVLINIKKSDDIENKDAIERIDIIFNNLLFNCHMNKLTEAENNLFLELTARYLINNIRVDDSVLNEYVNYYLSKNRKYQSEEIIIYLNYIRCFLNTFNNKEIEFNFKNCMHTNFEFGIPIRHHIKEMMTNVCVYRKILDQERLSEALYNQLLVDIAFLVLHEYKHVLQQDYINKNNDDIAINYITEALIMKNDAEFYKKYHDYFDTEIEADEYARNYLRYLLNGIIPKTDFEFYIYCLDFRKIEKTDDIKDIVENRKKCIRIDK